MAYPDQSALELLSNRQLFEEIHQLKSFFTLLFSEVANEFPPSYLKSIHHSSQGTKISKGNELEQCPYQVLDIVRDFDKESGFNVRLLNWWGRGLFVFVLLGKNNENIRQNGSFISGMRSQNYLLTKTASPWEYQKIIDQGCVEPITEHDGIQSHLKSFEHLQMVRKIVYPEDYEILKESLKEQVNQILEIYTL